MTELGNALKTARTEKGLSLDDLQKLTKIQKRYLVGIENGDYQMMPGKFYVRAFIKQYAEAVGLDPEELFDQYGSEVPTVQNDEIPEQLSRVQTKKTMPQTQSKLLDALPKILVVVFLLGAAVLIWWVLTKFVGGNGDDKSTPDQNDTVKVVESHDAADSKGKDKEPAVSNNKKDSSKDKDKDKDKDEDKKKEDTDTKQELKATEFSGKQSTYQLANAKEFKLKLTSTGETWVSVKNTAGKTYYSGMISDGESQEIDLTGDEGAELIIGNTTATDIYVNGEKLSYAISPQERVNQNISIQFQKAE
ncbi:helix-turn-helix domain-containing protein [Bacillus sp. 1P06AnD]|uniref:helix-turn-helix domain-containing protein n=1 Tax=Bacillus sp. 1P06AnD TaxID=3132208 RepID=UPI0039A0D580